MRYAMYPWLPERGLAMIAGWRGIGKTYLGLAVAHSIAVGGGLLGWRADRPLRVLYVDGEMDPAELQTRLRQIDCAARQDCNGNPDLMGDNLWIASHADHDTGFPDLSDEGGKGRKYIEAMLLRSTANVLFLDNLSSLCRSGIENDSESWVSMQNWLLGLRRRGVTVVMVHHTGKPDALTGNVSQRGTSKREDVLNTSILLHTVKGGGGFRLEFSKVRGFLADKPFKVKILIDEDEGTLRVVREGMDAEILQLSEDGLSVREIAKRLGMSKSTVQRRLELGRDASQGVTGTVPAGTARPSGSGKSTLLDEEC